MSGIMSPTGTLLELSTGHTGHTGRTGHTGDLGIPGPAPNFPLGAKVLTPATPLPTGIPGPWPHLQHEGDFQPLLREGNNSGDVGASLLPSHTGA